MRRVVRSVSRVASALVCGGAIAALVMVLGTRDLETYEHAFFSLDRGTAVQSVHVLGHPVYTLAIGLGVRLPLHGSLEASPAALASPYLPAPLTYWLLLTIAIGGTVLVMRYALEPLCGPRVWWLAPVLVFCAAPMVDYTIYNDWTETALTYCASIACVFAPHALLTSWNATSTLPHRRLGTLSIAGVVWGLIAASHPGYWPLVATALVCTAVLTLCRSDYPFRTRLAAVGLLAAVSIVAIAPQAPDITRELTVAGPDVVMRRLVEGPRGRLIPANLFPLTQPGPRLPFTYLLLAAACLTVGLASAHAHARRVIVGSALLSIALGVAAVTVEPGSSMYAPSVTWAFRDPAIAFAVLAAAAAAGALRTPNRLIGVVGGRSVVAVLLLAALQGPAYAAGLVVRGFPNWHDHRPWTRDMTPPAERAARRGLAPDRILPGERVALWPDARATMRNGRRASTDLADAGYLLVTAWTKQRTMRGVVEPNDRLFNQAIDLGPQVLCESGAVQFLQLRYLLMPADVECGPWTRIPGVLVDGSLTAGVVTDRDDRVRTLPLARAGELRDAPALSVGSALLPALEPMPGTSVRLASSRIEITIDDPSAVAGALMLPVAFDPAWHASSGNVQNVGGLVAVVGVDQPRVTIDYVPDMAAVLRAVSMTIAQLVTIAGFIGLLWVDPS